MAQSKQWIFQIKNGDFPCFLYVYPTQKTHALPSDLVPDDAGNGVKPAAGRREERWEQRRQAGVFTGAAWRCRNGEMVWFKGISWDFSEFLVSFYRILKF